MNKYCVNTLARSTALLSLTFATAFAAGATEGTTPALPPIRGFYVIPRGEFINVQLSSTELRDIQRISLPKGKYIVNASAVVFANNSSVPVGVGCVFMIDGLIVSEQATMTLGGTHPHATASLPLTVGLTLPGRKDLSLACQVGEPIEPGAEVGSQSSPITAIRVHRLTVSECCES